MNKEELIKKYETTLLRKAEKFDQSKNSSLKITLYRNMLEDLRTLDDTEITTDKAWEKIAESHPMTADSLSARFDYFLAYGEKLPEKVEVPQFVADEIEHLRDSDTCDDFVIHHICTQERFEDWLADNHDKLSKAVVNGYVVKKRLWVVRLADGGYFEGFTTGSYCGDKPKFWRTDDAFFALKFTDKAKAEAVATLVGGKVEEL